MMQGTEDKNVPIANTELAHSQIAGSQIVLRVSLPLETRPVYDRPSGCVRTEPLRRLTSS
jgi:hypothetical protein